MSGPFLCIVLPVVSKHLPSVSSYCLCTQMIEITLTETFTRPYKLIIRYLKKFAQDCSWRVWPTFVFFCVSICVCKMTENDMGIDNLVTFDNDELITVIKNLPSLWNREPRLHEQSIKSQCVEGSSPFDVWGRSSYVDKRKIWQLQVNLFHACDDGLSSILPSLSRFLILFCLHKHQTAKTSIF